MQHGVQTDATCNIHCWELLVNNVASSLHATLRYCYTGRFATTIFSATQHHNIVATMLPMVPTFLLCVALKIVVANLLVSRVTSPLSSLTERSAVKGSTRDDGKGERRESFSILSSLSPSSRDCSITAKRRLRTSQLPYSILDDYK